MKYRYAVFLVVMLFFISCATVHKGKYAKQVITPTNTVKRTKLTDGGLIISGRLEKSLSNDYYKFIGFTLENRTGDKMILENITIDFNNQFLNNTITVSSGRELVGWHEAMIQEKKRREFNRSTFFTSLFIGGGLLAVFGDDNLSDVGTGLVLGGFASLTIDEFNKERKEIQTGKIFPETHLLSGPIEIMPGFYQNKWIVINIKKPDAIPERVYIEYDINGRRERVVLPL